EALARGDAQPPVVEEGALAALGRVEFLGRRVVDEARHDGRVAFERNRDGELRDAVDKVGSAVERIDDPRVGLVAALVSPALLAEEAVAGPRLRKLGAQDLLRAVVGRRDEVRRSLQRYLQALDLAEVALEAACGLAGRLDHDVEERGAEHAAAGS